MIFFLSATVERNLAYSKLTYPHFPLETIDDGRTKHVLSFQLQMWAFIHTVQNMIFYKTAYLKVENSAQTSFRFSPLSFHVPSDAFEQDWKQKEKKRFLTYEKRFPLAGLEPRTLSIGRLSKNIFYIRFLSPITCHRARTVDLCILCHVLYVLGIYIYIYIFTLFNTCVSTKQSSLKLKIWL